MKFANIAAAMARFGVGDHALSKRVFEEGWGSLQDASARRLRDKIAHELSAAAIAEMKRRAEQLFGDMRTVLEAIGGQAGIRAYF